jgi:hypothetical protein
MSRVEPPDRALAGIKSKLERLFQQATADGKTKKGEDITVACDLAEDLRDVIVEYQVSIYRKPAPDSWLIHSKVFPTDGDL